MKKIIFLCITSLVLLSGCGKGQTETPEQIVENTKVQTIGKWESSEGETYEFLKGYKFKGDIIINGIKQQVTGDYNLVTDEATGTTSLSINTDKARISYIVEEIKDKSKIVFVNPNTGEEEKELKFAE